MSSLKRKKKNNLHPHPMFPIDKVIQAKYPTMNSSSITPPTDLSVEGSPLVSSARNFLQASPPPDNGARLDLD